MKKIVLFLLILCNVSFFHVFGMDKDLFEERLGLPECFNNSTPNITIREQLELLNNPNDPITGKKRQRSTPEITEHAKYEPSKKKRKLETQNWSNTKSTKLQDQIRDLNRRKDANDYHTNKNFLTYVQENLSTNNIDLSKTCYVPKNKFNDIIQNPSNYSLNQIIYTICQTDIYIQNEDGQPPKTLLEIIKNDPAYLNIFKNIVSVQTLSGHTHGILSVATYTQNNETFIVTVSYDKTVKIWNTNGTCLQTLSGHTNYINFVTTYTEYNKMFQANETFIVTASEDKTIRIWNTSGRCLQILRNHHKKTIISVATYKQYNEILQDYETFIVAALSDKTVKIWNTNGTYLQTLSGHTDYILSVATYTQTNEIFIVSASRDKTAKIWKSSDGTCLRTLRGHTNGILSVATYTQNNETFIITASRDKTVKIWNTNGTCLQTLSGHTGWVCSVATYSQNNETFIVSASHDETVKIWNTNGTCLQTISGHTDYIRSVATYIKGSDRFIVTASDDETAKIWYCYNHNQTSLLSLFLILRLQQSFGANITPLIHPTWIKVYTSLDPNAYFRKKFTQYITSNLTHYMQNEEEIPPPPISMEDE